MKITRAVALLGGALLLAGCSTVSTEPDTVALHYSAGAFSSTQFSDCVKHGTRDYNGPGDKYYIYPFGSRTYTFSDTAKNADTGSYKVVSSDNVEMTVDGTLSFKLDTACKLLQQFHEQIGIKYGADDSGDWLNDPKLWGALLHDYLGNELQQAMRDAGQKFPWQGLYNDPAIKTMWMDAVKDALPTYVKNFAREDFFTAFTLSIQKPQPPQKLVDQLNAQQIANQQVNTFNAQAAAQNAKIQQIKDLVAIMGPYGYVLYQAQQECSSGNKDACSQFLPVPQGTNINVTPGG